jgi:hypothetical protein
MRAPPLVLLANAGRMASMSRETLFFTENAF